MISLTDLFLSKHSRRKCTTKPGKPAFDRNLFITEKEKNPQLSNSFRDFLAIDNSPPNRRKPVSR